MTYNKTTWQTGDTITADKLNNIENGILNHDKSYVTEEFVSGTEGYRIWSNGRCEQWGKLPLNQRPFNVAFLRPYKDTNYVLVVSYNTDSTNNPTFFNTGGLKSTTGFKGDSAAVDNVWHTDGYLAS